MGQLYVDLFAQKRFLLDGVNVHLKLTRSSPTFCLMRSDAEIGGDPPPAYKIKLDEVVLYVKKITLTSSCYLGVIGGLDLAPAKYIIR